MFPSGLGKNIRDTLGNDLYAACKTLSPTNSDEFNLVRKYFQTYPTRVLTFFATKAHRKTALRSQHRSSFAEPPGWRWREKVNIAFFQPLLPLLQQHFHVEIRPRRTSTNSDELRQTLYLGNFRNLISTFFPN